MLFTAVTAASSYADVYIKYIDDSGVIHYTDAISRPSSAKVKAVAKAPAVKVGDNYHGIIKRHAEKYELDPSLIRAVITAESGFDPSAVSTKGAMGLMQLMPATAYLMGVGNPFNPEENIAGGVRYLKLLLDRYNGNLKLALAAYNAGPKTVEKYGAIPPISETKDYIKKILTMYKGKTHSRPASTRSLNNQPVVYKIVLEDGTILLTNSRYR